MVGTQRFLINRESTFKERLRLRVAALGVIDASLVAQARGHVWVVRPPGFRGNLERLLRHMVEELYGTETVVCYRHFNYDNQQKYLDMGVRVLLKRPFR